MKNTLLFVELTRGGHRTSILRYLVEYAAGKNIDVKIATLQKTLEQGGFSDFGVPIVAIPESGLKRLSRMLLPGSLKEQVDTYVRVKTFLSSFTDENTYVVFPTLQACGALPLGLALRGYCRPWVGLLMSPAPHLKKLGITTHHSRIELLVQYVAYRRLTKQNNCKRLACFDPYFVEWSNNEKTVYCPDPVEIASDYASVGSDVFELASVRQPILAVVGTIDKRKKIAELARVVNELPGKPIHLVVAGKLKSEAESDIQCQAMRELIDAGNVTTILRWLSDTEKDYVFHTSSIVWSGNIRNYGSSGAIVQAGMHSKPVIAMAGSMMGNWLRSCGGGPSIDMTDRSQLEQELKLLLNEEYRKRLGAKNNEVFSKNHRDVFSDILLEPFLDLTELGSQK